jgi:hypothetical protein
MTKKELVELIKDLRDDAQVVIEVHDTTLYEDLYDFTVEAISWTRTDFKGGTHKDMQEVRLTAIPHNEKDNDMTKRKINQKLC